MKKNVTIIIFIIIVLGIYWYVEHSPQQIKKRCSELAREQYQQGMISGPDSIGNARERCLSEHGIIEHV